jgi:hypothetical protein
LGDFGPVFKYLAPIGIWPAEPRGYRGGVLKHIGAWNSDEPGLKASLLDLFEYLPDVFLFAKDL